MKDGPVRFELVDRVLQWEEDRLVAVKNVTQAEEYLADHFPGFAVLPGVMMLEALVQAGRLLLTTPRPDTASCWPTDRDGLGRASGNEGSTQGQRLVLTEVRNVRYGQMVRPGQSLRLEVAIRSRDENGSELMGTGNVDGQLAVQGRFRLAPLDT